MWSMDALAGCANGLRRRFNELDLDRQFIVAGGLVAVLSMLAIGTWVAARVRADSIANEASNTAKFMDSFIAPLAQELQSGDSFSIGPIRALDEILDTAELRDRVVSVKIWKPDGRIAYARDVALIGQTFPLSPGLKGALAGQTVAEFDELDEDESRDEEKSGLPLLEVYSPIRADWSGDVIGVAEFYENATALSEQLARARLQGWLVTAAVTALICLSLLGIVRGGSRTIMAQRQALATRLAEVERIAHQNFELRQQVEGAARRLSELSEANLRRVGSDLHDGPAQLISLVALRLDSWRKLSGKAQETAYGEIAQTLQAALAELRQISRGLVLPELTELPLGDVVERAIAAHEARTHSLVRRHASTLDCPAPEATKICVYRFVQEGLNNAFRHAGGDGQTVMAHLTEGKLSVRVTNKVRTDDPPGMADEKIGLQGLRDRVESLGGQFSFAIADGMAALAMTLNVSAQREQP